MILLSLPCVLGFNVWSGFQPFGAGSNVLDLEDFLVSNIWLPLGSLVYLLFCTSRCGWGWKNFKEEANEGGGLKVKDNIRFYVSYILRLSCSSSLHSALRISSSKEMRKAPRKRCFEAVEKLRFSSSLSITTLSIES